MATSELKTNRKIGQNGAKYEFCRKIHIFFDKMAPFEHKTVRKI